MAIYTVHVPHETDPVLRAERTAFVRDGFSVWAFLFGPLYLLRCRAWIAAAVWVIVVLLGAWLSARLHVPEAARVAWLALVALLTGLEASTLRAQALYRRGFEVVDVVEGGSRRESERAFFRQAAARDVVPPPRAGRPLAAGEPVIGFVDGYPS